MLKLATAKDAKSYKFLGIAHGWHEGIFDGCKLSDSNIQLNDSVLLLYSVLSIGSYLPTAPLFLAVGLR